MLQEYGGCEDQEGDVGEEEEEVPSEPCQCFPGSVWGGVGGGAGDQDKVSLGNSRQVPGDLVDSVDLFWHPALVNVRECLIVHSVREIHNKLIPINCAPGLSTSWFENYKNIFRPLNLTNHSKWSPHCLLFSWWKRSDSSARRDSSESSDSSDMNWHNFSGMVMTCHELACIVMKCQELSLIVMHSLKSSWIVMNILKLSGIVMNCH